MNQTEQMRKHILDLYNAVSKACADKESVVKATIKSQGGDYKAIKQILATETAPLVRLTEEEVIEAYIKSSLDVHARVYDFCDFANALQDAWIAKNGGSNAM